MRRAASRLRRLAAVVGEDQLEDARLLTSY